MVLEPPVMAVVSKSRIAPLIKCTLLFFKRSGSVNHFYCALFPVLMLLAQVHGSVVN